MSDLSTLPFLKWNRSLVLTQGIPVLQQTKKNIDKASTQWDQISPLFEHPGGKHYSQESRKASQKFKQVVTDAIQKINALHVSVTALLTKEKQKDEKKLKAIQKAASAGLTYFTTVLTCTHYPTLWNEVKLIGFLLVGLGGGMGMMLANAAKDHDHFEATPRLDSILNVSAAVCLVVLTYFCGSAACAYKHRQAIQKTRGIFDETIRSSI